MRIVYGRGAHGDAVAMVQQTLMQHDYDPGGVDGIYGRGTAAAVERFQRDRELAPSGEVDEATWVALMGVPPPSAGERALTVTAAFEGHGYGHAAGNFDGAGLTWGIIGFTVLHGEVSRIILQIAEESPAIIEDLFQENTDELLRVMRSPIEMQVAWGDRISIGRMKERIADPWRTQFEWLGRVPRVRELQRAATETRYLGPARRTASAWSLRSELGLALAFDIHVQNGGIKKVVGTNIRKSIVPHSTERERRLIIANCVADAARARFREDVRSRKTTLATGEGVVHGNRYVLAKWGLDERDA